MSCTEKLAGGRLFNILPLT